MTTIFNSFNTTNINFKALQDLSPLDKRVTEHLKNVYATLAGLLGISALGVYFQITANFSTTISGILTFVLMMYLTLFTTYSQHESQAKRVGVLMAFAFFHGVSIGPLINRVIDLDQQILVVAFLATAAIFVCFSLAAIFAKDRSYLYIGGILSSALTIMCLMSLFNIFIRSPVVPYTLLYGGLIVFSLYVVYDTQLIIEKAKFGSYDYVRHSLELFLDFAAIFIRILIILADKAEKKKKKREKQKNLRTRRGKKKP
jgi:FtsH-binding integral membrane protein